MYNADQIPKLTKQTSDLLKDLPVLGTEHLSALKEVIQFHDYRYYIINDPLISDIEYDHLYKALEKIEAEHPELITPDSPTQRVAKGLTKEFPSVHHFVPMLSLENSYNPEDLIDWDRRVRELTGELVVEYCVEPKFDGASISLVYENDLLTRGATRGDGVRGDDITTNVKQIRSIPLSATFSKHGIQLAEIRGEVLMSKKNFKKYNDRLAEQNLPPLANPRNAAAGSLRIKDPKEVARRNLEAFLYNVGYIQKSKAASETSFLLNTHSGTLQLLAELGFHSPEKEKKELKGIESVIEYCERFEERRDDLPYEIDGMVIKVNKIQLQEKMGMTAHHPRWAIAYKFKARQANSTLKGIEFQVGRTGSITPVAKIEPASIGGVTVTSISLFNEEVIREKDLKIGDTVLVERAGDVIPYIVRPLTELRNGEEKEIIFPSVCPVCKEPLFKPEDEAVWRCVNINCEAQVVERIIHFTSKDAMDIRGLGEASVKRFYKLGFLKSIPDIYKLSFSDLKKIEGFGEKSITNLESAIQKSKQQPLHRLIFALGIRYVGETTAKVLAHTVTHLLEFTNFSTENLLNLEDVGPKVARSIWEFFHNNDNIQMLGELEKLGLNLSNNKNHVTHNNLAGQTFLFTGTLSAMKRSDAEAMVEQRGGIIVSSVSSKLNYLIVGDDAGSKLEKAKKIATIRILREDEFLEMINKMS